MARSCACGAVANLDAVIGDITKWAHHYDECRPLFDPDCRDGKHRSCVGGPCECDCHAGVTHERQADLYDRIIAKRNERKHR